MAKYNTMPNYKWQNTIVATVILQLWNHSEYGIRTLIPNSELVAILCYLMTVVFIFVLLLFCDGSNYGSYGKLL